jgi:thermitase
MKTRGLFGLALVALVVAIAPAEQLPDEILVKYHAADSLRGRALAMSLHATEIERSKLGVTRLKLPRGAKLEDAITRFNALPDVEFAEPNHVAHTMFVPNDPRWSSQYGPRKVRADFGWDLIQGSPNVIIAILDTGVDLAHPDLVTKLVPGYNFVSNNSNASDDHGHGTHCAGIAAAATNNAVGVAGVGFNSRIMPVKVLSSSGSGTHSGIANGVTWATDQGAKVVSMSLGGTSSSTTLQNAINYAWSKGVIVVAAAGNSNNDVKVYPAAYDNVISVGSTDSSDNKSTFSNFGSWVSVAAPGTGILNTARGGGYVQMSGTSMAAPHVAGQAALLWAYLGMATDVAFVRERIETTTDSVGTWLANGRVNVEKSLDLYLGPTRKSFTPTSFKVITGSRVSGGVSDLAASDDLRLVFRSSGTTKQTSTWTATARVAYDGVLEALELDIENSVEVAGQLKLHLWDYSTGKWFALPDGDIGIQDTVAKIVVDVAPSRFVSPNGDVQVRIHHMRNVSTSFSTSTDLVQIVTVSR